jgi:hypothetical protein
MSDKQLAMLHPIDLAFADFERSLMKARPSVSQKELGTFEQWTTEFGQERNCIGTSLKVRKSVELAVFRPI